YAMPLEITIVANSQSPIFKQIVDQIRLAAATGEIEPGHQLPSVRALAQKLVINPNTVARAYAELTREGLLETQQGRGVFIAIPRQIYTKAERLRRVEPALEAFMHQAISVGFSTDDIHEAIDRKAAQLNLPK